MTAPDIYQMTTTDILLILGGIGTLVCSIISALKITTTGRKVDGTKAHLEKQDEQLRSIDTQTNGNLTETKAQLAAKTSEVLELKAAAAARTSAAIEIADEVRRQLRRGPERRGTKGRK